MSRNISSNPSRTPALLYSTQFGAPPELRVISQPADGARGFSRYHNYVYRRNARPSYIYHAELGIDPEHLDFLSRPIEWLYTGRTIYMKQDTRSEIPESREDYGSHSTCTASKAAGKIYGASKTATLVVVKMPNFTHADIGGVLNTIYHDISAKRRQGKSVISISWGDINRTIWPKSHWELFKGFAVELNKLSVPIFVSAGNAGREYGRGKIDTAPAVLASWFPKELPQLVAVGSCNDYGVRLDFSQEEHGALRHEQIHAPGVGIHCIKGQSDGTSFGKRPQVH